MSYVITIQTVMAAAFDELAAAIDAKKVADAPAAREVFLGRWVAQAVKKQRFHHSVKADLQRWTQRARSAGTQAGLEAEFRHIQQLYTQWFPVDEPASPVQHTQLQQMIDSAREAGWMLHTQTPIDRKVKIVSEGQHSLVVCPEATQAAFNAEGHLAHPLSIYVRGPEIDVMNWAHQAKLAPTKVTAYKSIVKYHAEYRLWPDNHADCLMVMPRQSMVKEYR
ncbi:hypothetical protein BZG80_07285 [Salinivibrio sp. MA440]|uniref:DUF2913 family protein n=1 Tax=Salinivibrio sp. MA440 TaxID=1909456 RepID=UPI00098908BE|nr:DUF2913 family protein [Salinivibrio sp. MA440]OOF04778.1 hypothetical protein BZG80_07285 [Salinivibrio sp. MA440]